MKTKVRLLRLDGLAQMPAGTIPNQGDQPRYYAHLLTFVPLDVGPDGKPNGNIHLAHTNFPLQLILEGGKDEDIQINGEYTLEINKV